MCHSLPCSPTTRSPTSTASAEPSADSITGPTPPPPPPSLPPPLVSALPVEPVSRPSPYLEKLACMPANYLFERPEQRPYVYRPIYYFFYGTLMKPDVLKGVLGLETDPVLRPAKIYGYKIANWGQYKALIDGEPDTEVTGSAYKVRSVEEESKLAYYETNAYALAACEIYFTDHSEGKEDDAHTEFGKTFRYAGDAHTLQQGRFDWALWEMQMGRRLPPAWHRGARRDVQERETEKNEVEQDELREDERVGAGRDGRTRGSSSSNPWALSWE
ncbi:hypothetical protein C8A00DRAFT_45406 [Chaetomidium leptoderma]|uniref:Putative gamma-glutamylcyclotransferase n=1 Tax=Chaetomidium leptoderma TaxID=669021 RepID=A0AAN6ZTK2_9PEZI|nr:hypothetical protein C8A00DRAFT_45406 [Chaetomidium leptoderma]